MVVEEIKSILEKNGYEIDPDVTGRIETMVESIRDEELDIPDSFIWVTLYQIKQLLKIENFVGPHIRGIISYL